MVAEAQPTEGSAPTSAEHAMDPVYAERIGVDVDELFITTRHW